MLVHIKTTKHCNSDKYPKSALENDMLQKWHAANAHLKWMTFSCHRKWHAANAHQLKGYNPAHFALLVCMIWIIKLKLDWAYLGRARIFCCSFAISKFCVIASCFTWYLIMGQYWVNDIWLKPDFEALNTQNFQVIILDLLLKNLKTTQGLNINIYIYMCVCVCV